MDNFSPEFADFLAELARKLREAGATADEVAKAMRASSAAYSKVNTKINATIDGLDKLEKKVKDNTGTMGQFAKEFVSGVKTVRDMTGELDSLTDQLEQVNEQIEALGDSAEESVKAQREDLIAKRGQIEQARIMVETSVKQNIALRATTEGLLKFGGQLSTTVAKSMGGFARGLQDGSSAFSLAGGLMEGAMDVANAGAQTIGSALQTAGGAAAALPGPMKAVGLAASTAGAAISKMGDAAAAVGKFIVNFMVKQLEDTVAAFNKTTTAGALFADGMTGMVKAAGDAGLTVKQFSEVISQNSDAIAQSGMGVADGAKRIGGALKAGGKEMQTQLLKLGFGFEEQAGLVAETMATMKGSAAGPLRATDAQIAEQTQKYAENLRVIASITGEDAKKKAAQVREQASQLAFQQKLAQKTPEQRAAVERAMMNMSDLQRKNFMDMVNFGNVINKEGAVAQAQSKGLSDAVTQSYQAYLDNTLDEGKARAITAATQEQRKKDLLASTGLATAQAAGVSGTVGAVGEAMGKELQYLNKSTPEAIAAAEAAKDAQKQADDQLTNATVTAAEAAQEMAMQLQQMVLPRLADFAELSGKILDSIRNQLAEFEDVSSKQDALNWKHLSVMEKIESGLARFVEWLGDLANSLTGGVFDKILSFFGGKTVKETKEERIAKETAYLQQQGRTEVGERYAGTEAAKAAGVVATAKPAAPEKEPALVASARAKQEVAKAKLDAAEAEIKTARQKFDAAQAAYEKDKSDANKAKLTEAATAAMNAKKNLDVAKLESDVATSKMDAAKSTIAAIEKSKLDAELTDARKESETNKAKLAASTKESAAARQKLEIAKAEFEKDKSAANKEKLDAAKKSASEAEFNQQMAKMADEESSLRMSSAKKRVDALASATSVAVAGSQPGSTGAPAAPGGPVKGTTSQVLATIKKRESGGNYEAQAKGSTASGAYQFINSTWQSLAKKFGIGEEYQTAKSAPPNVQDSVAGKYVDNILNQNNGDVSKVPLVWYTGNAQGQMSQAALAANSGLTPGQYQAKWMTDFNKIAGKKDTGETKVQAAEGGIATGPTTGYPATLHGEEAIVPLNKDKPVPVKMDLTEMTDLLTEMVRILRSQQSVSEKILQASA